MGSGQFFLKGLPSHSETYEPNIAASFRSFRSCRNLPSGIPRALWGLRPESRVGHGSVVLRLRLRRSSCGRSGPRARSSRLDCSYGGTGQFGIGTVWNLAWLLRLLDDPPQNLWLNRGQTATGARRPFAPLCPHQWTTVALAYLKEAEVLQGKRSEVLGGGKNAQAEEGAAPKPNPKRRPGRGGKGAQNAASASTEDSK